MEEPSRLRQHGVPDARGVTGVRRDHPQEQNHPHPIPGMKSEVVPYVPAVEWVRNLIDGKGAVVVERAGPVAPPTDVSIKEPA
jgi:hypothetical protein